MLRHHSLLVLCERLCGTVFGFGGIQRSVIWVLCEMEVVNEYLGFRGGT